jgi:hypothetical protein
MEESGQIINDYLRERPIKYSTVIGRSSFDSEDTIFVELCWGFLLQHCNIHVPTWRVYSFYRKAYCAKIRLTVERLPWKPKRRHRRVQATWKQRKQNRKKQINKCCGLRELHK